MKVKLLFFLLSVFGLSAFGVGFLLPKDKRLTEIESAAMKKDARALSLFFYDRVYIEIPEFSGTVSSNVSANILSKYFEKLKDREYEYLSFLQTKSNTYVLKAKYVKKDTQEGAEVFILLNMRLERDNFRVYQLFITLK